MQNMYSLLKYDPSPSVSEIALQQVSMFFRSDPKWEVVEPLKDMGKTRGLKESHLNVLIMNYVFLVMLALTVFSYCAVFCANFGGQVSFIAIALFKSNGLYNMLHSETLRSNQVKTNSKDPQKRGGVLPGSYPDYSKLASIS